ncbi:MAG: signal peptidase I [Bacteroidota bacterium]
MKISVLIYIIIFVALFLAIRIGLYGLFKKAGKKGWEAFVPIYSDYIWLEIIGKPAWWVVLTLIPIVRTLVKVSMNIEIAKSFGQYSFWDHVQAVIFPFIYFPKIGFDKQISYFGPPDTHKKVPEKSGLREWADAFLYAGVAALIIRTFFIEAFMIPTSSMERTLMAGDFLFVSKFHYGPRMPMVPLAVPFVHNKVKLGGNIFPSYLEWVQFPYLRFPGLTQVERNDIVVFNYPAHDVHDLGDGAGKVKPTSLKENYIKRCVAIPGDTLEIIDQQIYIDGEEGWNPPYMQYQYMVTTNGTGFSQTKMRKLGFRKLNNDNPNYRRSNEHPNIYIFWMPEETAEEIAKFPNVDTIEVMAMPSGQFDRRHQIYPSYGNKEGEIFSHNIDNFGPIVVPKKGMTVKLNPKNLALYQRPIEAYEGHDLKLNRQTETITIDGEQTDSYTFGMDYYFMMGDNRHNSEDGRYWGFVPEDHIVGKPLFIWLSYESDFGLRFSRIGTKYIK